MKVLGNIIWFLVVGLWSGLFYFLEGLFWCITIIGIPFGTECFKIAKLMFVPFGKSVKSDFDKHPVANVIWAFFGGMGLTIGFFFTGVIFCLTIIGIPFGKQCFKLAHLAFIPFGAEVA